MKAIDDFIERKHLDIDAHANKRFLALDKIMLKRGSLVTSIDKNWSATHGTARVAHRDVYLEKLISSLSFLGRISNHIVRLFALCISEIDIAK